MITDEGVVAGNVTDKYGSRNPVARYLMARFLEAVRDLYVATAPSTVLELGCGEGEVAARLVEAHPAEYTATDISERILEIARSEHPGITFRKMSATDVDFEDDSFDCVVACEVLEHLDDPERALREIARVSRRDVVLSVPREPIWRALNMARGAYWRDLGNTPGHLQHWGRRAFIRMVSRHLDVVEVRSPLPWTVLRARVR